MVKAVCVLGLLAILLLSLPAACGGNPPTTSQPVTTIGQSLTVLSSVSGNVTLLKAGAGSWVYAAVGTRLDVSDTIRTDAAGQATVTFFDGSTIELAGGTEIKILELRRLADSQATAISVSQEIGQTVSQVAKFLDPASRYEVVTPAAVAAVRGSAMLVNVASDGTTTVGNIEGDIVVMSQGVQLSVPEGQHSEVRPGQAPTPPQPGLTSAPATIPPTSLTTLLITVSNLQAEFSVQNEVRLAWESSGGATSFRIERSQSESFSLIEQSYTAPASARSFVDNTVFPGAAYFYRVWAVYAPGGSVVAQASSNWVVIILPALTTTTRITTTTTTVPPPTTPTTYPIATTIILTTPLPWPPGPTITLSHTTTSTKTTGPPTSSPTKTTTSATSTTTSLPPNVLPVCSIRANRTSGKAPLSVNFYLTASDLDGSIASWQLDVNGDGNPDFSGSGNPPSRRSFTYSVPGNYLATLAVVDNRGAVAHASMTIRISPPSTTSPTPTGLWCMLEAEPESGTAPLSVLFTLSAGGGVVSWELDCDGDGYADYSSNDNEVYVFAGEDEDWPQSRSFYFEGSGVYTATLTVWGAQENSAESSVTINLAPGGTLTY